MFALFSLSGMLLAPPPDPVGSTDDAGKLVAPSATTKEKKAERKGFRCQESQEQRMTLHARWPAGICSPARCRHIVKSWRTGLCISNFDFTSCASPSCLDHTQR